MSPNPSPIEMIIMRALTIFLRRVHQRIGRNLAAFSLMALAVAPLSAQTFRGSILGTVMDPNAAVVPGSAGPRGGPSKR